MRYAPLYIHRFRLTAPRQLLAATAIGKQYQSYDRIDRIPDRLRWCRHSRGLTQKEVADQLGISAGVYKELEAGTKNIPAELAHQLAELYGIPPEDLMDGYCRFQTAGQARQIRNLRSSLQMSRTAFAARMGIPLSSLRAWENGKKAVSRQSWERYFRPME